MTDTDVTFLPNYHIMDPALPKYHNMDPFSYCFNIKHVKFYASGSTRLQVPEKLYS